jgi:hypothetical protein
MPSPSKEARLYKRKARFHVGKIAHQAVWIIKRATKKRHPPPGSDTASAPCPLASLEGPEADRDLLC